MAGHTRSAHDWCAVARAGAGGAPGLRRPDGAREQNMARSAAGCSRPTWRPIWTKADLVPQAERAVDQVAGTMSGANSRCSPWDGR